MIMDKIALTLLIIGGLNWGSVGLFRFDLVGKNCASSMPTTSISEVNNRMLADESIGVDAME